MSLTVVRGNTGEVRTLNSKQSGQIKHQPAILLFRSVDAVKQKIGLGGFYVTTWLILHDFPAALNLSVFGTTCNAMTKGSVNTLINIFQHFI